MPLDFQNGRSELEQILSVWSRLDARRRIIVVAATLAMFAAVLAVSRMASQPSLSLLYAGLDPTAAGEVVAALDQQGVTYDVRAGAIFVDANQRDALRMTLAADGLPANNGQGYELLDSLSGFGTTSQMFDAAYWRAKEGELARTIVASPQIKAARVHISNPATNPFQRDMRPTASVTVNTVGGSLNPSHARALRFLVSSAVAGLPPEDVAVIDARSGVVLSGDDSALVAGGGEDRAAELRKNIERILEARVGPGNAVVEVSVELINEREAITERRFDPDSRFAISSEVEERSSSASGSQGGSVTVASNVPDGDAGGASNSSNSQNSESRERINYEVNETTREIVRAPGAIKRVSVAVLVDGIRATDPNTGDVSWTPRDEAEIESLRELVASAVGFDEARGDTITLKSLEFEPVSAELVESNPSLADRLNLDTMSLIQLAVLALVSLILGLFVVRPILNRGADDPAAAGIGPDGTVLGPDGLPELPSLEAEAPQPPPLPALAPEIAAEFEPLPGLAVVSAEEMMNAATGGGSSTSEISDPVERLRKLIEERQDETIEVLRSWMEDEEAA